MLRIIGTYANIDRNMSNTKQKFVLYLCCYHQQLKNLSTDETASWSVSL
jgi:hypothetical protein